VIDFNHYWAEKGHSFGECFFNNNQSLMYINIPKCASTWTKTTLSSLGWVYSNYYDEDFSKFKPIVVLRDPVERWISGISEYFTLYHADIKINEFTSAFYDLLFDKITFDDHTEKQLYFIKDIDFHKTVFFKFEPEYTKKLYNYLNISESYKVVQSPEKEERICFKNCIIDVLKNEKYVSKLKQYYKEDYKLINSVNFYN